jgi:hypothetical protein
MFALKIKDTSSLETPEQILRLCPRTRPSELTPANDVLEGMWKETAGD